MSYNGSGTFQINSTGQPVVGGTIISSSTFNALTADLATGLTTAITKDGQTTTTARIPFAQGINSTLVTDASSVSTGSIFTAGGVGIAKKLYVGTDASIGGTLGVTGVATFSASPIYSSLTASSAVATDASKNLVSVTNTGTGSNVLATGPTIASANLTTALTLNGAAGTNGQVLTSAGSGLPSWTTIASGGIATIASGSFPAAAVLDIINIPATYAYLVVQVNGVSSDTGSNFLLTQVSVDNGTSFDTTANNYLGQMLNSASVSNTSRATLGTYASTAGISELGYATIVLEGYQGGCNLTYNGRITHGLTDRERTLGTYVGSTSAINALRFTWSAGGNFDAGTYALYGVA